MLQSKAYQGFSHSLLIQEIETYFHKLKTACKGSNSEKKQSVLGSLSFPRPGDHSHKVQCFSSLTLKEDARDDRYPSQKGGGVPGTMANTPSQATPRTTF